MRLKLFELLDCLKFAYPSLRQLDVFATAANIVDRLQGRGFMSYGQIWPLLPDITSGVMLEEELLRALSGYPTSWKNRNLQEVAFLLKEIFGGKGRWYRAGLKPIQILPGAYFKPSIRGTWYYEQQAYSVCINARKYQPIPRDHVRFLGRGIHEFHSIDDPNDPLPMIVDLSAQDGRRELKKFVVQPEDMMSLEEFESILRKFFEALSLAGVTTIPEGVENITDLFRTRRFD